MKYFKDNFRGYFQDVFGQVNAIYSGDGVLTFKERIRKEFNGIDLELFCDVGDRKVGFDKEKMYIETLKLSDHDNKWIVSEINLPEPIERVTYVREFMVLKGKKNIYYYGKKIFSDDLFPIKDVIGVFEIAPSTIVFEGQEYKVKDIQISNTFQAFLLEGNKALIKYKDEYYFKEYVKNIYVYHSNIILLMNTHPVELNIIGDSLDPNDGVFKFFEPSDPVVLQLRQSEEIENNKVIQAIEKGNIEFLFFPKSFIMKVKLEDEYRYIGFGDFSYVKNAPFKYKIKTKAEDLSEFFPTSLSQVIYSASNDLLIAVDYDNDTLYTNL
jgi:hypothetical protein